MAFHKATSLSDLNPGMTGVQIGDLKLLLVRDDDGVRAFQGTCPHAEAPLADGALCGGRIICPWHMGSFDAQTGALLEPVAMRGLHRYTVQIAADQILVDTDPMPSDAPLAPVDARMFAIAGAGAASVMAAVTLREKGFTGRICMIGPDETEPLDRTLLSKMALAEPEFDRSMLPLLDPDLAPGVERIVAAVTGIDPSQRAMTLTNGDTLHYDAALLATGSAPVAPQFGGPRTPVTLRTLGDLDGLLQQVEPHAPAVVIGTSFIGMEVAASLAQRNMRVTVVGEADMPFAALLGNRLGRAIHDLFVQNGVQFRLGSAVARVDADAVLLASGERLAAKLVVAGLGVTPVLDYAPNLPRAKDGGLVTDASLRVAPGLWAAGDIASPAGWPRVEHWRLAAQHGRLAALGMLGQAEAYAGVPFFWSALFDKQLRSVGQAAGADETVYDGDVERFDFTAWYLKGGKVSGAVSCGRDQAAAILSHALRQPLSLAAARDAIGA